MTSDKQLVLSSLVSVAVLLIPISCEDSKKISSSILINSTVTSFPLKSRTLKFLLTLNPCSLKIEDEFSPPSVTGKYEALIEFSSNTSFIISITSVADSVPENLSL